MEKNPETRPEEGQAGRSTQSTPLSSETVTEVSSPNTRPTGSGDQSSASYLPLLGRMDVDFRSVHSVSGDRRLEKGWTGLNGGAVALPPHPVCALRSVSHSLHQTHNTDLSRPPHTTTATVHHPTALRRTSSPLHTFSTVPDVRLPRACTSRHRRTQLRPLPKPHRLNIGLWHPAARIPLFPPHSPLSRRIVWADRGAYNLSASPPLLQISVRDPVPGILPPPHSHPASARFEQPTSFSPGCIPVSSITTSSSRAVGVNRNTVPLRPSSTSNTRLRAIRKCRSEGKRECAHLTTC